MIPYRLEDLQALSRGSQVFTRGKRYEQENRIRSISWDVENNKTFLRGSVAGSHGLVYEQRVYIHSNPLRIEGLCGCPVGINCKHVIALLIRGMKHFGDYPAVHTNPLTPDLRQWLNTVTTLQKAPKDKNEYPKTIRNRLIYVISHGYRGLSLSLFTVALLKNGDFSKTSQKSYSISSFNGRQIPQYIRPIDVEIIRLIQYGDSINIYSSIGGLRLEGEEGYEILKKVLSTKRVYWNTTGGPKLSMGEDKEAVLSWSAETDGKQKPFLEVPTEKDLIICPLNPPHYIDTLKGEVGLLKTKASPDLSVAFLKAPSVLPEQVESFSKEMEKRFSDTGLPVPHVLKEERRQGDKPIACLKLFMGDVYEEKNWDLIEVPMAKLSFDYKGHKIPWNGVSPDTTFVEKETLVTLKRHQTAERAFLKQLRDHFFRESRNDYRTKHTFIYQSDTEGIEQNFACLESVNSLEAQGWKIDRRAFPFQVDAVDDFVFDIEDSTGEAWFACDLSTTIDGKKVDLVPIFVSFLSKLPHIKFDEWIKDKKTLQIPSSRNRYISISAEKVEPFLRFLLGLLQAEEISKEGIKLPRYRSAELAALEEASQETLFQGGGDIRKLGQKLRHFKSIQEVSVPESFQGVLRPYQREGLNWLQFLRDYQLNGILADDMGLGKTIQALAHICLEKEAGRLTRPCLIVSPTSVIPNWLQEATIFAPSLNILSIQGSQRKELFSNMKDADIVLTSYPLLSRDKDFYVGQPFHLVILDEAQVIKNPRAQVSQVARSLNSNHRLCMTGTPMENHLGELWSLMSFLMSGLLGSEKKFRSVFRTPIEKRADQERHQLLSKRVKPFMLRRTKQAVIEELPDKQVSIVSIPLSKEQRALYETVRLRVNKKVKQAISTQGIGRSHILVLEALLKLRQVCCDPRLVKGVEVPEAPKVSSKLERLMEMIIEMIEEGRRILLFSQFTSMLSLIEERLKENKINYVKLTGSTKDRKTPVEAFQKGEIPLFLISLKAGGSGLNLTAADTVIHYDPWWNPAVEDQATDRAHRMGQRKKVFVYKLVSKDTVEEKILSLQSKKKALTENILEKHTGQKTSFDDKDLKMLLEPLPE